MSKFTELCWVKCGYFFPDIFATLSHFLCEMFHSARICNQRLMKYQGSINYYSA